MGGPPMNGSIFRLQIACQILGVAGFMSYATSKFTSGKLVVVATAIGLIGFLVTLILMAFSLKNCSRMIKYIGLSILAAMVGGYLILFICVYFFQDTIANRTSTFFQPRTIPDEIANAYTEPGVLPLNLLTPDGFHLRGWMVQNSDQEKAPLLIYYGGSGSESSEIIPYAKKIDGWSIALLNYRGFGLSEGIPTHAIVLADALFIYDNLVARADIDPERVVVMGYSLGSGIAVYLSEQRQTTGTVLVSPYDYWTLIGLKRTPLYAPLTSLMNHYFNSIDHAPGIHTPLLCLIGAEDVTVPTARSLNLVNAWGGRVEWISYPGEDHGLLFHPNRSWVDILDFLSEIDS